MTKDFLLACVFVAVSVSSIHMGASTTGTIDSTDGRTTPNVPTSIHTVSSARSSSRRSTRVPPISTPRPTDLNTETSVTTPTNNLLDVPTPEPTATAEPLYYTDNGSFTWTTDFNPRNDFYVWPSLSVNDVAELLGNMTTQLIDTYPNEMQRTIIYEQLKYCPYTPLCRVKVPESIPDLYDFIDQVPCCKECICNYTVCQDKSTTQHCCPDLVVETRAELVSDNIDVLSKFECIRDELEAPGVAVDTIGIRAITKCPIHSDSEINSNCMRPYAVVGLTFSDVVPVTDKGTGITYRNRFCAACNHVSDDQHIAWNIVLRWSYGPLVISSEAEAMDMVLSDNTIKLMFVTDEAVSEDCILDKISSCNVTGNWTEYDSDTERACLRYSVPYMVKAQYYNNVFCAICNGQDPQLATCDRSFSWDPGVAPFSVLLSSKSRDGRADLGEHLDCGPGFVEDRLKKTCLKLHCLNMKWLSDGKCIGLNVSANINYIATVRLTPLSDITILKANLMADNVIMWFYHVFMDVEVQSEYGASFFSWLCGAQLLYVADTTGGSLSDRKLLYYDVRLQMGVASFDDPDDIMDAILHLENRTMDQFYIDSDLLYNIQFNIQFTDNQPDVNFNIVSDVSMQYNDEEYHYTDHVVGLPLPELLEIYNNVSSEFQGSRTIIPHVRVNDDLVECELTAITVRVTHTNVRSCAVVKLSKQDYNWTTTTNGIHMPDINQDISNAEFLYDPNRTVIVICEDTFVSKVNRFLQQYNDGSSGSSAEGILTIVSLSISLVCLILAFVTFCIFRELRTLPGKNNMALIVSIFVAQVMFIIAMYGGFNTDSTACIVVGLLLHLCWLLALMWMNVCTFHVFRLFALTTGSMPRDGGWKPILWYSTYALGISTVFIAINITVSLFSSDMSDVGYGGGICYISSPRMVGYTFGIPVGLVVLANICMFVTVIVQIERAPVVDRNVKNQRNDILVFAKLSSLTGASWLFGLLFDWTDVVVFSYFFILLNASQGLFLFLAFACNKRVFDMYVKRIRTGRDVSYKSSLTRGSTTTTM